MENNRDWMNNRLNNNGHLTDDFVRGVTMFLDFAFSREPNVSVVKIKCPCLRCDNKRFLSRDDVNVHLYQKGFTRNYSVWYAHGELTNISNMTEVMPNEVFNPERYIDMIRDACGDHTYEADITSIEMNEMEEAPNPDAEQFYSLIADADESLWEGCTRHSKLSGVAQLLNCKSEFNVSNACHDRYLSVIKSMLPDDEKLPSDMYQTKKMMKKLGMKIEKFDACINNCQLYYKDKINEVECSTCGHSRYKPRSNAGGRSKNIPYKVLRYLPLTPRLQRMYMSAKTAEHMTWHATHKTVDGVMTHPSDGEAWTHFDHIYPLFSSEIRNVRIGICTDGFNPFGHSSTPYSCWPVLVVVYNLPPWMCMKQSFVFLTLLVPGPKSPGKNLDVFLRPLIDELKLLWSDGIITYDKHKKQNFQMRVALMWTISDFPAYAMLSGWSTHGKLACPYCMEQSKAFSLVHGGKVSFFDCHRQFLPSDHPFRKQKDKFRRGHIELDDPPQRLSGEELFLNVSNLPEIDFGTSSSGRQKIVGFGSEHNWTRRSIFWELPYWRTNLIRHNLDVMHIEKNVFDNIFNTVMNVKDKTKDNTKARLDLALICKRPELELVEIDGKLIKNKATYTLDKEQIKDVCIWTKGLRFPDGYVSNLTRCVNLQDSKFYGMKSHDCHVFMQRLLPIAFRDLLPKPIWEALTELSQFFQDICARTIEIDHMRRLETNIVEIICKLEKIFPPGFFDSMEHLPIHLAFEARVGGPVHYRWMYPFERTMHHLKKKVSNKAKVEGSICEAYVVEEISTFCSMYFESSVSTKWNQIPRNDDGGAVEKKGPLSIFNHPGRPLSKHGSRRRLENNEFEAAKKYVLLNCAEINPFLRKFDLLQRELNQGLTDAELDDLRNKDFPTWLCTEVQNDTSESIRYLSQLARGPSREVKTHRGYFVNGFKFHTEEYGNGKSTMNSGVCIKGSEFEDHINDFYGMLREVIELDYIGWSVWLFKCDWYDTYRGGVRVDQHGLIEIKHRSRLPGYDPFVLASQAQQVYYLNYPSRHKDRRDWWVVCKTSARGRYNSVNWVSEDIQNEYYQEMTTNSTRIVSICPELDNHGMLVRDGITEVIDDYSSSANIPLTLTEQCIVSNPLIPQRRRSKSGNVNILSSLIQQSNSSNPIIPKKKEIEGIKMVRGRGGGFTGGRSRDHRPTSHRDSPDDETPVGGRGSRACRPSSHRDSPDDETPVGGRGSRACRPSSHRDTSTSQGPDDNAAQAGNLPYVGEIMQKAFVDHKVTRAAVKDLKDLFTHPFPTWGHVPPNVRAALWERFERRFSWPAEEAFTVREAWEKTLSRRLTQTLNVARKEACVKAKTNILSNTRGHGPIWMLDVVWEGLLLHWASEDWKKTSQVASTNRLTLKEGDVVKHSGGSITFGAHQRRLEKELQRSASKTELFQRTHKKKGTDEFIDQRSRIAAEKYERAMIEKYGEEAATQHEFDPDAWVGATGGLTKGKLYGFGGRASDRNYWVPSTSQRASGSVYSGLPVTRAEVQDIVREMLLNLQQGPGAPSSGAAKGDDVHDDDDEEEEEEEEEDSDD